MKRLLSVFLFLLLIFPQAISQTLTRMQGWGLDFESIAWFNDQEGIVVGERLITHTSDGGTTWEEVLQNFEIRFFDVVVLENGRAVAVGESGSIYLTNDGGKTWQQKISGSQNDLLSIALSSSSSLTIVGQGGELLNSLDAGETWTKISTETTLNLNDITFINENSGYIAADGGTILKSLDRGNTWILSSLTQDNALYGIAFSSELIGYAVGENGLFVKTTDGGVSWSVLRTPATSTLRKVAISPLDAGIVTAVGDLATVVRTANSGRTFSKRSLGSSNTRDIKGIFSIPSSNLVSAVGQDGYLTNSINDGTSWTPQISGIRNDFTSIDFKNLSTGYIAGEDGNVYLTTNGASTITHRPIPESILIETLDFWSASFGYTGSADGKIYRTSNSARNWVPVFTPANRVITGFYLFASSVVYLAGSQGYISRSFDSGATWDQGIISNTNENLKGLMFFDFVYGFAIGENGHISWSAGGNEWETLDKITEQNLNDLAKIDTTRAFVVGDGGVILRTDDKARTWKQVESGTTKNLNSVDFFGENNGYIAGEDGLILISSDGGVTWVAPPSGTTRNLNSVSAGSDQKAYFSGDDGTILAYICTAPAGGLGDISGESELCLASTNYSIPGLPEAGSEIVWRVDGGEILSGQGTSQIEVQWTSTGRNAVLVSRSNFCGTGETSALEVTITTTPPTDASIVGDGAVCQGIPNTYSLPLIDGVGYTWAASGGTINRGQGTHAIEIVWNQPGAQQLSVILENRCGHTEAIVLPIAVNSTPDSPSEISGEIRIGLGEQTYEIQSVSGLNYRWSIANNGGRITSGQGSGSVTVLWEQEGDFELAVEAQNECGFSTKQTLSVNVNVITALEPKHDGNLKIYPNPSQGNLTLSSEDLDFWTSLVVYNAVGQLVETQSISQGQQEVQLSGLPKGLLLIRLQGKNGVLIRKILVH